MLYKNRFRSHHITVDKEEKRTYYYEKETIQHGLQENMEKWLLADIFSYSLADVVVGTPPRQSQALNRFSGEQRAKHDAPGTCAE